MKKQIAALKKLGAQVVAVEENAISPRVSQDVRRWLTKAGMVLLPPIEKQTFGALCSACGASALGTVPVAGQGDKAVLGVLSGIVEEPWGEDGGPVTVVEVGPEMGQVTLVVRGVGASNSSEAERSIVDALGAVGSAQACGKMVPGGGVAELAAAAALRVAAEEQLTTGGQQQGFEGQPEGLGPTAWTVFKAYARALERIPQTLASTAGLQPLQTVSDLATAHRRDVTTGRGFEAGRLGIEVKSGCIADVGALGVWESSSAKKSQMELATEGAIGVLRVEEVLKCRGLGGGQNRQ